MQGSSESAASQWREQWSEGAVKTENEQWSEGAVKAQREQWNESSTEHHTEPHSQHHSQRSHRSLSPQHHSQHSSLQPQQFFSRLSKSLSEALHIQTQTAHSCTSHTHALIKAQILHKGHLPPWRDTLLSIFKHCSNIDSTRIDIRKRAQYFLNKALEDEEWMQNSLKYTLEMQQERHAASAQLHLLLERLEMGENERIKLEARLKELALQPKVKTGAVNSTEALRAALRKRQVIRDELVRFETLFKERAAQLQAQRKAAQEKLHNARAVAGVTPAELQGLERQLSEKSASLQRITQQIRAGLAETTTLEQSNSLASQISALQGQASELRSYLETLAESEEASTLALKVWDSLGQLESQIAHCERGIIQLESLILDSERQSPTEPKDTERDSILALETRLQEVNETLAQVFTDKQQLLTLTLALDEKIRASLQTQGQVAQELSMLTAKLQGLHSQLAEKAQESQGLQARVQELRAEGAQEQGRIEAVCRGGQVPLEVRSQLLRELQEWRKVEVLKRLCRDLKGVGQGPEEEKEEREEEGILCLLNEHLIKLSD